MLCGLFLMSGSIWVVRLAWEDLACTASAHRVKVGSTSDALKKKNPEQKKDLSSNYFLKNDLSAALPVQVTTWVETRTGLEGSTCTRRFRSALPGGASLISSEHTSSLMREICATSTTVSLSELPEYRKIYTKRFMFIHQICAWSCIHIAHNYCCLSFILDFIWAYYISTLTQNMCMHTCVLIRLKGSN